MRIKESDILDLSINSSTSPISVVGGPISIQPVVENLVGVPTYTLEVSNDEVNFSCFHRISTNLTVDTPIVIQEGSLPWAFLRLTVTTDVGVTGYVRFKVFQGDSKKKGQGRL